jgi:hypothetical protein
LWNWSIELVSDVCLQFIYVWIVFKYIFLQKKISFFTVLGWVLKGKSGENTEIVFLQQFQRSSFEPQLSDPKPSTRDGMKNSDCKFNFVFLETIIIKYVTLIVW